MMFSWPISFVFAIIHAVIWILDHFTDNNDNTSLMKIMCDMVQFIVVVPVPNVTAGTLAEQFMQHILLKFRIFHLIILNNSSSFKGIFSAICKVLNINPHILAKINHKGLLVEKN